MKRNCMIPLLIILSLAFAGCQQKEAAADNPAPISVTETTDQTTSSAAAEDTDAAEENNGLVLGVAQEGALALTVKNNLEQAVTAFSLQQEQTESVPSNLMPAKGSLSSQEEAPCYYLPEDGEDTAAAYCLQVTLEDGTTINWNGLSLFDVEETLSLEAKEEGYCLVYQSLASGQSVCLAEAAEEETEEPAEPATETPVETQASPQAPAETPAAPAPQPTSQPAPQPAPVEELPAQTTEGCLSEGGGPVFN